MIVRSKLLRSSCLRLKSRIKEVIQVFNRSAEYLQIRAHLWQATYRQKFPLLWNHLSSYSNTVWYRNLAEKVGSSRKLIKTHMWQFRGFVAHLGTGFSESLMVMGHMVTLSPTMSLETWLRSSMILSKIMPKLSSSYLQLILKRHQAAWIKRRS